MDLNKIEANLPHEIENTSRIFLLEDAIQQWIGLTTAKKPLSYHRDLCWFMGVIMMVVCMTV